MAYKVSALTALAAGSPASGDLLEVVDVSDTSLAASGTNKKVTVQALLTPADATIALGGTSNRFTDVNAVKATITGGTVTSSVPLITATQTWNGAAEVFDAISYTITDTTSALRSTIFKVAVGSSTKISIAKGSYAVAQYQVAGSSSYGDGNTYFGWATGDAFDFNAVDGAYNNAFFGSQAGKATTKGYQNTYLGSSAGSLNTTGNRNTGVGQGALYSGTTATQNVGLGHHAGLNVLGNENTLLGWSAGQGATGVGTTAAYNTVVGSQAALSITSGQKNTLVGRNAAYSITTGSFNTALGLSALFSNSTGSSNVALGYYAGAYETGSDAFYVDNRDRTDTAGDKAGALLYGTFNATAANQTLKVNATLTVAQGLVTAASTTTRAGFNLPHGAAPTSPVDGDMWTTTTGLLVRINGVTKTVTLT